MKKSKKILSLLLSSTMLASCFTAINATATEETKPNTKGVVFSEGFEEWDVGVIKDTAGSYTVGNLKFDLKENDKLEIAVPEDYRNVDEYIKNVKAMLTADPYAQGRYCIYTHTLASTLIYSAVKAAAYMLNGDITKENMSEKIPAILKAEANCEDFAVSVYDPANPQNIYKAYCPGFEIIK